MNYEATLRYLDEVQARGIKLGLENMTRLLAGLGNPQDAFPAVVVGGTNGKGSVCAFLASILRAAGLRAGLYTSPHLVRYEERIAVGLAPVSPDVFAEAVTAVRERAEALLADGALPSHPTHFEILTAAAFHHFRQCGVEAAVMEVGMGGRLDAVAMARTCVAVITNVSLEHSQYLGATVQAIAAEKAGILRDGCAVVTGVSDPAVLEILHNRARGRGIRIVERHRAAQVTPSGSAFSGRFALQTERTDYGELLVPLAGRHQVENATLAVLAAEALWDGWVGPQALDPGIVAEALARTHWPGRMQIVGQAPLFILDGAHNPAGAAALARALRDLRDSGGFRRLGLIFGVLGDKEFEPMVDSLAKLADYVVLCRGRSERFRAPDQLADSFRRSGREPVVAPDLAGAIESARSWASPEDAICLCGSLYLVGDAFESLGLSPYR